METLCTGSVVYPIGAGGAWTCTECGISGFSRDHRHRAALSPLGSALVSFAHYLDRRAGTLPPAEIANELLAFMFRDVVAPLMSDG